MVGAVVSYTAKIQLNGKFLPGGQGLTQPYLDLKPWRMNSRNKIPSGVRSRSG